MNTQTLTRNTTSRLAFNSIQEAIQACRKTLGIALVTALATINVARPTLAGPWEELHKIRKRTEHAVPVPHIPSGPIYNPSPIRFPNPITSNSGVQIPGIPHVPPRPSHPQFPAGPPIPHHPDIPNSPVIIPQVPNNFGEANLLNMVSLKPRYETIYPHLGGRPLYFVNGILTSMHGSEGDFGAIDAAQALSIRLNRTVRLVYNPTNGGLGDLQESLNDRLWFPPNVQLNPATKELAGAFLQHAQRGESVSIVSHSQGTMITRNAITTLEFMGYSAWVRKQLIWVAMGTPLRNSEIPPNLNLTIINDPRDAIDFIGRAESLHPTGVDRVNGINVGRHSFVKNYVNRIYPRMVFDAGNGRQFGDTPEMTTRRYDDYVFRNQ